MATNKELLTELEDKLIQNSNQIKLFHLIVQMIDEMDNEFCHWLESSVEDVDTKRDDKWFKVSQRFQTIGYNSYRFSPENCRQIFDEWIEFYVNNYQKLNKTKLRFRAQQNFNLIKIVHILDFKKLWTQNDSIYISLEDISKVKNFKKNYSEYKKFGLKSKAENIVESEDYHKNENIRELISGEPEIKFYHSMVKLINSMTIPKTFSNKYWNKLSNLLKTCGYSSEKTSPKICCELFYKWSAFYALNYDEMDNKLEPKIQEIFDLLKIVHILDMNTMWATKDDLTYSLLSRISAHNKIKEELTVIEQKDFDLIEMEDRFILFSLNDNQNNFDDNLINNYFNEISFDEMGLKEPLLKGIEANGMEKPSEIQQKVIPHFINGRDIIGQSHSGSGKTSAFVISVLQMIDISLDECQALILAPTRELANQIHRTVMDLGKFLKYIDCMLCIGGTSIRENVKTLNNSQKPHIIVGTLGRVLDLVNRKAIVLQNIRILVLDESHQLFYSRKNGKTKMETQLFKIFKEIKPKTQLFFSSTTFSPELLKVLKWFAKNAIHISPKSQELALKGIQQYFVEIEEDSKLTLFCSLFNTWTKCQKSLVYCNSKKTVDSLAEELTLRRLQFSYIHGKVEETQRKDILDKFQNEEHTVLITTDLLSRGVDLPQVSLIVNYDLPTISTNYIHRVGRIKRFEQKGVVLNFVTPMQKNRVSMFERIYMTSIKQLPNHWIQIIYNLLNF